MTFISQRQKQKFRRRNDSPLVILLWVRLRLVCLTLNPSFPVGASGKESPDNAGQETQPRHFPWRQAWQLTLVFLTGESHGQRSLAGCSLKELDMTEETWQPIHSLGQQPWLSGKLLEMQTLWNHWSRSCILIQFPGASWVYSSLGSPTLSWAAS